MVLIRISVFRSPMNNSFRIPFYLGCTSLVILAVIHLITHFLSPVVGLNEDQENLLTMYNSIRFQVPLGQERTLSEIMTGYSLYFPTLLLGFVLMLLVSVQDSVALKLILKITLVFMLILIIITFLYMVIPPLIMMCFSAICFGLSLRSLVKSTNL